MSEGAEDKREAASGWKMRVRGVETVIGIREVPLPPGEPRSLEEGERSECGAINKLRNAMEGMEMGGD